MRGWGLQPVDGLWSLQEWWPVVAVGGANLCTCAAEVGVCVRGRGESGGRLGVIYQKGGSPCIRVAVLILFTYYLVYLIKINRL